MSTSLKAAASLGLALAMGLATPLAAQDGKPGRYTMSPTDGGFVRLDTLTGEMSLCRRTGDTWGCEPMDDSDAADRGSELAELRRENERLKAEIERLDDMLGLGDDGGAKPAPNVAPGLRLPTEKQIEDTLDYFTNIMKKFQERLKDLEQGSERAPGDEAPADEDAPRRERNL